VNYRMHGSLQLLEDPAWHQMWGGTRMSHAFPVLEPLTSSLSLHCRPRSEYAYFWTL
jgi:hypothetical protein